VPSLFLLATLNHGQYPTHYRYAREGNHRGNTEVDIQFGFPGQGASKRRGIGITPDALNKMSEESSRYKRHKNNDDHTHWPNNPPNDGIF
jgi:hypothetical protein